jgi:hypothetical protein
MKPITSPRWLAAPFCGPHLVVTARGAFEFPTFERAMAVAAQLRESVAVVPAGTG